MKAIDALLQLIDSSGMSRSSVSVAMGKNVNFIGVAASKARNNGSTISIETIKEAASVCGYSLILAKENNLPESSIIISEKES